jgi:hypothetical protein
VTGDRFGQAEFPQAVPGGHVQPAGTVGGISQNAMAFRAVINPSLNPSRQASSSVLRFFLLIIFPQASRN